MLKALIQNPALYAQESIEDAAREMRPATEVENTPAEKLDAIQHAEGSLSAARRYLDMAKAKARHRKRAATGRIIHRDVATRYLKRYGGHTQKVPTPVPDSKKFQNFAMPPKFCYDSGKISVDFFQHAVNAVLKTIPEIKDRRTLNDWTRRYKWKE